MKFIKDNYCVIDPAKPESVDILDLLQKCVQKTVFNVCCNSYTYCTMSRAAVQERL